MLTISDVKVGDLVHHETGYSEPENGIIKEIRGDYPHGVWVIYHCGGDWGNYANYTGALTYLNELNLGWRNDD